MAFLISHIDSRRLTATLRQRNRYLSYIDHHTPLRYVVCTSRDLPAGYSVVEEILVPTFDYLPISVLGSVEWVDGLGDGSFSRNEIPRTNTLFKVQLCSPDLDLATRPLSNTFRFDFTTLFEAQCESLAQLSARSSVWQTSPANSVLGTNRITVFVTERTRVVYRGKLKSTQDIAPSALIVGSVRMFRQWGTVDGRSTYNLRLELGSVNILFPAHGLDPLIAAGT